MTRQVEEIRDERQFKALTGGITRGVSALVTSSRYAATSPLPPLLRQRGSEASSRWPPPRCLRRGGHEGGEVRNITD